MEFTITISSVRCHGSGSGNHETLMELADVNFGFDETGCLR